MSQARKQKRQHQQKKEAERKQKEAIRNRRVAEAQTLAELQIRAQRVEDMKAAIKDQASMEMSMFNQAIAVIFYTLRFKEGWGHERMKRTYQNVCELADEMNKANKPCANEEETMNVNKMIEVLEAECGICIPPPNAPLPMILGGHSVYIEDETGRIKWQKMATE